jgi:hypothetical protein
MRRGSYVEPRTLPLHFLRCTPLYPSAILSRARCTVSLDISSFSPAVLLRPQYTAHLVVTCRRLSKLFRPHNSPASCGPKSTESARRSPGRFSHLFVPPLILSYFTISSLPFVARKLHLSGKFFSDCDLHCTVQGVYSPYTLTDID